MLDAAVLVLWGGGAVELVDEEGTTTGAVDVTLVVVVLGTVVVILNKLQVHGSVLPSNACGFPGIQEGWQLAQYAFFS